MRLRTGSTDDERKDVSDAQECFTSDSEMPPASIVQFSLSPTEASPMLMTIPDITARRYDSHANSFATRTNASG
eukprot:768624-Hanusia_phi.AAC.5